MGTVFRKTFTKPLPAEAEILVRKGERFARWKSKGRTRTAPLTTGKDGAERITLESPFYVAKYRDGAGVVQVVPAGCKDETAARQVLADLERKAELVRSGVMTAAEAAIGKQQAAALGEHIDAFDEHLRAKRVTKIHREDTGRYLRRLATDCPFTTLAGLLTAPEGPKRTAAALARRGSGMLGGTLLRTRLGYTHRVIAAVHPSIVHPDSPIRGRLEKVSRRPGGQPS